jgi:replicative superfamily II helicase
MEKLIPTSDFKYGKFVFSHFNRLQTLCFPYHDRDCNLIVSAATSAGKTVVAEQQIAYTITQNCKAIFLSPLKAVTQEKYDDWTDAGHDFSRFKIEILTGDHKMTTAKVNSLKQADLILMTSEMLDTRTRYISNDDNNWLLEVGLIVVDESHLLTTSRGPALEVGLMRFAECNPKSRITLLSATMSNVIEMKQWIQALNSKPTEVVATSWRPVELEEHYLRHAGADISQTRIDMAITTLKALTCPFSALSNYLTSPNTIERYVAETRIKGIKHFNTQKDALKTLVFVHTKAEGEKLCRQLKDVGIEALFHNADLDKTSRLKLEKQFKKDDLNVLVATSTLAWGINMPARNVIIMGNRRGPDEVADIDIKQMIGRAGRFGMYDKGDAFIICNKGYQLASEFKVESRLKDNNVLGFHLVAEVYGNKIKTVEDGQTWAQRSLAHVQYNLSTKMPSALKTLVDCGALSINNGIFTITPQGKIARDLYLNPLDIAAWKRNFNTLAEASSWNRVADLAWALTNQISCLSLDYTPKDLEPLAKSYTASCSFPVSTRNRALGAIVFYKLNKAHGEYDTYISSKLDAITAVYMQLLSRDSGRIFGALKRLDRLEGWLREKDLTVLHAKVIYGVGEHLLELVSIPGVGETIATQLYQAGIQTLDQLLKNKDNLHTYISRKASVTKILKGLEELQQAETSF